MTNRTRTGGARRLFHAWPFLVVVLALTVLIGGGFVAWARHRDANGQGMTIPGSVVSDPAVTRAQPKVPTTPRYVTSISEDRRYFLDQMGDPILIRGDAPWSLLTDLSESQAKQWLTNREEHGFNAAIVSLIGAVTNGGPRDDGGTFDGVLPFVQGDITRWNKPYWTRVHAVLRAAADHGITVMLYPIDGWTVGKAFVPKDQQQCNDYGAEVARFVSDLPNIVWMTGGDYFPRVDDLAAGSDVDHCMDAMVRGIRSTGDRRPFSIQLAYPKSISSDNPYWARRVDWNFVYTYQPTYRAVLDAYASKPTKPALMSEANYEGLNLDEGTPDTTNETLRRQTLWALTSGSAGDVRGSADWEFHSGWESRLDTPAVDQQDRLRSLFADLRWWELRPDVDRPVITSGRGTYLTTDQDIDVLENDYATAAQTPDGKLTVAYVPTQRTIGLDLSRFASGVRARWIDPASGASTDVALTASMTTPGANADGDHDWLLVVS